jgi:putative MATE family efflux protein
MNGEKRRRLLEGPILSSLIVLAVPIVLTNLLQTAYQLIDAFWVGRLGGEAVAVMSVVFPVSFLAIALGMGFSIAASSLVAQYAGAGKWQEVTHTASQSMFVAIIVGLLLGVFGYVCSPYILSLMGVPAEIFEDALSVIRVTFFTTPFSFIFMTYQSLMRGVGDTMKPLYIVGTTVFLNAILDPLFIFGFGPIPEMGVVGAVIATCITQGISAVVGIVILLRGSHGVRIIPREFTVNTVFMKRLFALGAPTSAEQVLRSLGFVITTVLVVAYGTVEVAAYGVGANVMMVVLIPALGLSMAVAALVGQNIGAGKPERAHEAVKVGARVSFVALALAGAVAYVAAKPIVGFFIDDSSVEVVTRAVAFVRVTAVSFGLIGLQMVYLGAFRAAGSPGISLLLTFVAQWLLQLPLAFILSRYMSLGVEGIWWAGPISQFMTVLFALYWYRYGTWQKSVLTEEEKLSEEVAEEIMIEEGVRRV